MEKRYIISPPSFFCQKKFPSQHKVWQDFDGDDDYADRCLGRQSQGGGGAALMSSCPQPKPTSNPTLVLPATIHYTLAHNQNLHPTLARLLYPIQCKLAYYTSIYLPTTKTYTRTLHLAAYYTLYTIHYTVYTCLLYYYPLFTCPQQKPTPYP